MARLGTGLVVGGVERVLGETISGSIGVKGKLGISCSETPETEASVRDEKAEAEAR